jgi:hypothetical protein
MRRRPRRSSSGWPHSGSSTESGRGWSDEFRAGRFSAIAAARCAESPAPVPPVVHPERSGTSGTGSGPKHKDRGWLPRSREMRSQPRVPWTPHCRWWRICSRPTPPRPWSPAGSDSSSSTGHPMPATPTRLPSDSSSPTASSLAAQLEATLALRARAACLLKNVDPPSKCRRESQWIHLSQETRKSIARLQG